MTWQQLTGGLTTVARTGSTFALPVETTACLYGLGYIASGANDAGGVVLTELGRTWYQRAVVDRENWRLLEAYAPMIGRMFGEGD